VERRHRRVRLGGIGHCRSMPRLGHR
jgi:hypothetical protein